MRLKTTLNILLVTCLASATSCSSTINSSKDNDTVSNDTSTAVSSMRYLQNGRLKLGIDLKLGGAVTYLSDEENGGKNMINSYDWGRQIQMSYYSGPWPYIGPNGERPSPEWEGLGWNPIQSGDAGGHRAKVLSFEKKGEHSMLVKSIPMQWPHKTGVAGECVFETLYQLDDNVITMTSTIINDRADKTQYRAGSQEMPAVYTNGPWYQVVTYLGDQPFTNQPTSVIVDKGSNRGWPWVHFYTPENWVALLDENGKGIGVFQPEVMAFNAGFHPNDTKKGVGGEKDVETGHIAPVGKQIIDHNIKWTYTTSFILGDLNDIRSYAQKNWQVVANPEWKFDQDRNNWFFEGGMKDTGFPIEGELNLTFEESGTLAGPTTFWKAEDAPFLEIEGEFPGTGILPMRVEVQPVGKSDFTDYLNWTEGEFDVEKENKEKSISFPKAKKLSLKDELKSSGKFEKYRVNLAYLPEYKGAMKSMKIVFETAGTGKIKHIKLAK